MNRFRIIAIILSLASFNSAFAADRFALVQAANGIFCPLVQHTINSIKSSDSLFPYKGFLVRIRDLCSHQKARLHLVKNFEGYVFKNADSNRFMGTSDQLPGTILISEEILNQAIFVSEPVKPFNFILQTLMHEYANSITAVDQKTKDLVVRLFAERYYPYETAVNGLDLQGLLFSIPTEKIDQDFATTEADQVQPSYLLLLEDRGVYQDLTPTVDKQLTALSPQLRSSWTESNRMALMLMSQITSQMKEQFKTHLPQFKQQMKEQLYEQARRQGVPQAQVDKLDLDDLVRKFSDFTDIFDQLNSEEMRLFTLNQIRFSVATDDEHYLLLQGFFALNRSKVDKIDELKKDLGPEFSVNFDGGLGIKKIIRVPLIIKMKLNRQTLKVAAIAADLRPELSYEKIAKVGQISRLGPQVKAIKIKMELNQPPQVANLRLNLGSEHILLPCSQIQEVRPKQFILDFEIPENLDQIDRALWAESILIDQSTAYMLDRLIQITEGAPAPRPMKKKEETQTLLSPGLIVRDLKNQVSVANSFHPFMPLFMMNKDWYSFMTSRGQLEGMESSLWFNLEAMELRFGLKTGHKIRQVRLQMSYDVIAGYPEDEDAKTAFKGQVTVDGKTINVWSNVGVKDQQHYYQTILFNAEDLNLRTSGDILVVAAKKKVPFLPLPRPLQSGYGYGPPMVRPQTLEVVLDDGHMTTLIHTFPNAALPGCDDILNEMKFSF